MIFIIIYFVIITIGIILLIKVTNKKNKSLTFIYKENKYYIISRGVMKDTSTDQWIRCITYRPYGYDTLYTRSEDDFYDKFIPLTVVEKEEAKNKEEILTDPTTT